MSWVVLDLDGTILRNNGEMSAVTRQVLHGLGERGVKLTLASGRLPLGMGQVIRQLGIDMPYIASNGACVLEPTGRIWFTNPIPLPLAREALAVLEEENLTNIWVNVPTGYFISRSNQRLSQQAADAGTLRRLRVSRVLETLSTELPEEPLKISVIEKPEVIEQVYRRLQSRLGGSLAVSISSETSIDLNAQGVTKARALEQLSERLKIPLSEVIAAGNAGNDLEMIRMAGIGIAVANAPLWVQDAADVVVASNEEDGVAHFLRQHFGL